MIEVKRNPKKRKAESEEPLALSDSSAKELEQAAYKGDVKEVEALLKAKAGISRNDGKKWPLVVEEYYNNYEPEERRYGYHPTHDRLNNYRQPPDYLKICIARTCIVAMLKKAELDASIRALLLGLHPRVGARSVLQLFPPHPKHSPLGDRQALRVSLNLGTEKQLLHDFVTEGMPGLYWAVSSEHISLSEVQILLNYKANPNIYFKGRSALHRAVLRDEPSRDPQEIKKMAEYHGERLLERDPNIVEALLKAKAKPDAMDCDGRPVLIAAILQNQAYHPIQAGGEQSQKIIEKLLEYKADPNICANTTESALMFAVSQRDLHAAKALLDAKADVTYSRHSRSKNKRETAIDKLSASDYGTPLWNLLNEAQIKAEEATRLMITPSIRSSTFFSPPSTAAAPVPAALRASPGIV